jgi:hypothetical protein
VLPRRYSRCQYAAESDCDRRSARQNAPWADYRLTLDRHFVRLSQETFRAGVIFGPVIPGDTMASGKAGAAVDDSDTWSDTLRGPKVLVDTDFARFARKESSARRIPGRNCRRRERANCGVIFTRGGMAEWSMAVVLKTRSGVLQNS